MSISERAEPIPLLWWIFIILIVGLGVPTLFEWMTADKGFSVQLIVTIIGFIVDFVFIYATVWILTYFHYRRFLKVKKGVNFFTSKWFRFEQITLFVFFLFGLVMGIRLQEPIYVLLACCYGWTGIMGILYFYEWLFKGRTSRHTKSFSLVVEDDGGSYHFCEDRREHG
ncbi:MAG: hypothetical protein FWH46_02515 [Methanimicrococcus sp.]|nr:hypothetical protein [Methanimicrococcus sp.]